MAVVAQLSVNLSAQTAAFSKGLGTAKKDLRGLEGQAGHTMRTLKKFTSDFAGLRSLGLGGSLTLAGGVFAAQRFVGDSLKAFAEVPQGRELKRTMTELDTS